jgi:hypothetical protein
MTIVECRRHLWELKFTAGVNQRYHQRLESWFGALDKSVRIAVGVLAVLSFWTAFPNASPPGAAFWIGLSGVIAALVLNVIPIGVREKFHGEMFRGWSDLRSDADRLEIKVADKDPDDNAPQAVVEFLMDAIRQEQQLHSQEPSPFRWLLVQCEQDERESLYGEGLRTNAQIEEERKRRELGWQAVSGSAVAVALPEVVAEVVAQ